MRGSSTALPLGLQLAFDSLSERCFLFPRSTWPTRDKRRVHSPQVVPSTLSHECELLHRPKFLHFRVAKLSSFSWQIRDQMLFDSHQYLYNDWMRACISMVTHTSCPFSCRAAENPDLHMHKLIGASHAIILFLCFSRPSAEADHQPVISADESRPLLPAMDPWGNDKLWYDLSSSFLFGESSLLENLGRHGTHTRVDRGWLE